MLKHYYHGQDVIATKVYGTYWVAQSFTPDVTFTCTGLSLFLNKTGNPSGTLTYRIYLADGSGNPMGDILTTGTVSYATVNADTALPGMPFKVTFSSPVVLYATAQYVFVVNLSAGDTNNCLQLMSKATGAYAGGNMKTSSNSGGSWSDQVNDLTFDLWDATASGITHYYSLKLGTYSKILTIYRDTAASTIESCVSVVASSTSGMIFRSANYLYIACSAGSNTTIYRYTPQLVLDTTWGTSGVVQKGGTLSDVCVSYDDDWVVLTTYTTRGYAFLFNASGAQVWTQTLSVGSYYYGCALPDNTDIANFFILTGGDGLWQSGERRLRSTGAFLSSFWTVRSIYRAAMRESNGHCFAVNFYSWSSTIREYQEGTDAYVWTVNSSPNGGQPTSLIHDADNDFVFLGTTWYNNTSLYKFDGSTGAQTTTFNTGGPVRKVALDRNGKLLVTGSYTSDGVGTTAFRVMSTDLVVEWRFDTNFNYAMWGAVQEFITYEYPTFTIEGSGAVSAPYHASTPSDADDTGGTPTLWCRPESPIPEHLLFLTTINRSIDGTEERIACRKVPRKIFEFRIADSRQYMESVLYSRAAKRLSIPRWHEPVYLSTAALAGDEHVHVTSTALSEFIAGGFVLVSRGSKHDALEIEAVTDTLITFADSGALLHDYPIGTQVLPVVPAYIEGGVSVSRRMDYSLYDAKFAEEPQDNDLGLTPYVDGELTISDVNASDGDIQESISSLLYTVNNPQGLFSKSTIRDSSDRGATLGFRTHTRAELWALREMLYRLQGRKVSFYLMTFAKDLIPIAALSASQTKLYVEYCGFSTHVDESREIRICLKDGTYLSRTIMSWQIVSSTMERLIVDAAWPSTVQVTDIDRIEYKDLIRFDTDDVVIQHVNALGYAHCDVPVLRVAPPFIVKSNPVGLLLTLTYQES